MRQASGWRNRVSLYSPKGLERVFSETHTLFSEGCGG